MINKEIEFKNLLTEKEYKNLIKNFSCNSEKNLTNINYYFDNKNILKNNNCAIRIRKNEELNEITLKIKNKNYSIEINEIFHGENIENKILYKNLPNTFKKNLAKLNINFKVIFLTEKIITFRIEKKLKNGLLCLDKNFFENNIIDYEIEFEANDFKNGGVYFNNLLKKYDIINKKALPKIARAINYKNKGDINMKIAWIGTGVMGENMASHLIDSGYELFVYNRTKEKCNNLVEKGAKLLENIYEAPQNADIIFTMVGYPKDVEEVYLSENGLIKTAKENQVFIDMTTSSPTLAKKLTYEFKKINAHVLDLPVTGGDIGAKNKTLTIMAGGNKEIFENKVKDIVKNFATNITYFGEAGKGQYAKLANQIAIATTMVSMAESLKFAKECNLDLNDTLKTISSGSASSFSLSNYGKRVLENNYKPGFFIHHFIKDMKLALEECEKMNIELRGLNLVYELYSSLEKEIRYNEGTQSIIKCYDF